MIVFKVALIILVAAPFIVGAFWLWYQMEEYVRHKNLQEASRDPSRKRKKNRRKRR